jgi:2-polyprenyl-3-methyl-5-hydroxy-6-metoxy-1,4-benzoquinol methylase
MDLNKITHHMDVIKKCIKIIEDEMQNNPGIVVKVANTSPNVNLKVNGQQVLKASDQPFTPPGQPKPAAVQTFEKIVNDPEWPEAVPSDLLADETPEDMMARATGLLEATIDRNLEGLSFLDFGCGEGYTIPAVLEKGVSEAVGYDIKESPAWDSLVYKTCNKGYFTSNYDDLEPASFDVILLYDVLDHAEKPQEVLERVGKLLAPNGIVYVRCHPWTSRHGGHMYRTLNKAYVHLAVDDVHLKRMGYTTEPMRKVLRPLKHYKEIIQAAGFKAVRDYVKNDPMENFFRNNENVKKALHRHWDTERLRTPPLDDAKINHILEIEFVDFVLQQAGVF